ncbi:AraC family transcriptional regulator [Paenibacillus aceris]|uniref:AraC-like DNA-binding protein n=1 Tax=Paenibacillus aceris TaxID=869555 RepID=A0ABS4HW23_9BACL|nr:AraC family transcriptional regulator [Paenibacillus aceris]MBP1962720.1 AraC-like DNA-binding protein [Paenibacillus aceris]NHW33917.1 AraC family transcriptional regulator [Paenibacillus aceris]
MRRKNQPERLTSERFIHPSASFHIYVQHVDRLCELHWHEFYELCFVLSGNGLNVVNGITYELRPGSLFLLTPADFHEIGPLAHESLHLFNLVFSDDLFSEELKTLFFQEAGDYQNADMADRFTAIEAEFRLIWEESQHLKLGHKIIVKGSLERILLYIARATSAAKRQEDTIAHPKHPDVQRALLYIHHHFREGFSLEDAAKQAGLAPNYFSLVFRKTTGIPFQTYVQNLRLKFAKSLLISSNYPITEICYASGFHTLTHFERVFKQRFGQTPRMVQKMRDS